MLVYSIIAMTVFIGFVSFALDWGRVQLSKTELSTATDAAAMAGASYTHKGTYYARMHAKDTALKNRIGGKELTLLDADVLIGRWDTATRTFETPSNDPNAVRVTGYLTQERGSAIPLTFAGAVSSHTSAEAREIATAVYVGSPQITRKVRATANPFLAGMGPGSIASHINPHHNPDYGGDEYAENPADRKASPQRIPAASKMNFTFGAITGTANHDPNDTRFQPDGKFSDIGHNNTTTSDSNSKTNQFYHENNIHDMIAPINALVGVFLNDDKPTDSALPVISEDDKKKAPTDYSTPEARNRLTYEPKLKQIFFIGDGLTDNGVRQTFVAPEGATRLYLATWDFYEWNNNGGEREVEINPTGRVYLVE